ncbi:MAG: PIG-L deacetylase family protein [Acidimicrobiales bacterium]
MGDLLTSGPVTVDLPVPASALAIGAHPDDIEFGCGATLARWAAVGCRLHHLVLTDGSKGSWDPDADLVALVSARRRECRDAADVIDGGTGATSGSDDRVIFAEQVDGELENGRDQRREVARIIRTVRPAVVLGHDPWRRYRLHPDHRAAGFLTIDALVAARDPHFFPELELAPHRPEVLLLFEADLPNHLEDARGFEERKIDALLCHQSQWETTMGLEPAGDPGTGAGRARGGTPSADPRHHPEFSSKVRRQLADHGALAGLGAAEAFREIADL